MSTNYTKLKSTITDYLARDDISATVINTFIDIIEADITASFSPRELDEFVELPIENGYVILPDDYRLSRVVLVGNSEPLQQIDPRTFFKNQHNSYITTVGNKMYIGLNAVGSTAKILYSKRIPPLYEVEENVISKLYPSLYIFGCLKEASAYIDDKAKLEQYSQKYQEALEMVAVDVDTSRFSGSQLAVMPPAFLIGGQ